MVTLTALATALLPAALLAPVPAHAAGEGVHVLLTTPDHANALTPQPDTAFSAGGAPDGTVVTVDENTTYQTITGMGASLTGSSVWEMDNKLDQTRRDDFMRSLFDPDDGIGISLLRQPVGGSDQNAPGQSCSYDDNGGAADPSLSNFSIAQDSSSGTIGLLHQAQQLAPQLRVMASVWCLPQWMLSGSGDSRTLDTGSYQAYSDYLAAYLEAYAAQGIPVWGITPQNEPLQSYANFGDNLTAAQEADLIKNNLGPTLAAHGLDTELLVFDHNWDHPEYAQSILDDPAAAQYVAGSAWHKYAGWVGVQSTVHDQHPDKGIYFTEASPSTGNQDWPNYFGTMGQYIDILRNWSQTFLEWTIASNPSYGPGSCSNCGALAYIDDSTGDITYSADYYLLGHLSKYVRPGAQRISSTDFGDGDLKTVAFRNADGGKVLVAYNGTSGTKDFGVNWGDQHFSYSLPAGGVATFGWGGTQSGSAAGPLDRSGWTATASATYGGDAPGNVLDGDVTTRWNNGRPQAAADGDALQVDMGTAHTIDRVSLDATHDPGDYARGYALYLSADGTDWGSPVAQGSPGSAAFDITFPAARARYLKVVLTADSPWWWSVDELDAYGS
ncbi:discoidin domain-containing protein [Streptomyces sp. NPDC021020]|uniref:discoidin domain-containing protein n=1 Tax=Streptomyces sp. NPDC021020 TaxID=3365109 RepID=UPI0037AF89F8